jgi:hypothetical protein
MKLPRRRFLDLAAGAAASTLSDVESAQASKVVKFAGISLNDARAPSQYFLYATLNSRE